MVRVRLGWLDYSPALHHHTTECIDTALGRYASRIREVTVHVTDADGARRGPHDKRCDMEVCLQPSGTIAVCATAADSFAAVDRAARRARALVAGRLANDRRPGVPTDVLKIA